MAAAEGVGLLAIDLGEDALHAQRQIVSDTLRRDFGGGVAEWEDSRHALFTLKPERLPAGETAADNVLRAAIAVREPLSSAAVSIACDVLSGDASDAERWLLPRRLRERVGEERHAGAIVITRSVAACRAARRVPLEPVRETIEALFTVKLGARARVAPLGRWVAPFRGALLADGALNRPIEDGLLVPEKVAVAMDASELLLEGAPLVVVVAPAWTGKTYLAQRLQEALRRAGTPCHLTSLEHREGGHASWPDRSFLGASDERVWIVDALDEAIARDVDLLFQRPSGPPEGFVEDEICKLSVLAVAVPMLTEAVHAAYPPEARAVADSCWMARATSASSI